MELKAGITGKQSVMVTMDMTAKEQGSGELPVFSTPKMIALMENTAYQSVAEYLEEGQGTVGTYMAVKHTAATPVGMMVTFETVLKEAEGKRLLFEVKAYDEKGSIGVGEHERFIINNEKFLKKTEEKKKEA